MASVGHALFRLHAASAQPADEYRLYPDVGPSGTTVQPCQGGLDGGGPLCADALPNRLRDGCPTLQPDPLPVANWQSGPAATAQEPLFIPTLAVDVADGLYLVGLTDPLFFWTHGSFLDGTPDPPA